jgi:hypothetical protein
MRWLLDAIFAEVAVVPPMGDCACEIALDKQRRWQQAA